MPLLTCSSRLLFYSLLFVSAICECLCLLFPYMDSCCCFLFNGLCECILTRDPWSLNFFAFSFSLAPAASVCRVGHFSFWPLFLCALPFLSRSVPVLQHWPLLCDVYDISDSAHRSLLFECLQFISLPCVSFAHTLSLVTPTTGARLLDVYSNVSHLWCRCKLNRMKIKCFMYSSKYDFLSSCCISPSLSLCVSATAHCFIWEALC